MAEYIEREALIKEIYHRARLSSVGETTAPYLDWKEIVSVIKDTPTADVVKVKRGYWKTDDDPIFGRMCVCSVCGSCPTMEYKHCPYCGAKMDLKEGAEE